MHLKSIRIIVEAVTGAPRAELVNGFVEALIGKNVDAALAALARTEKAGISMIVFSTLALEKARFILLVQNSPLSKSMVQERVSPDDMVFIEAQAARKALTPAMLSALLLAVDGVGRARIEALPLELAAVEICR